MSDEDKANIIELAFRLVQWRDLASRLAAELHSKKLHRKKQTKKVQALLEEFKILYTE